MLKDLLDNLASNKHDQNDKSSLIHAAIVPDPNNKRGYKFDLTSLKYKEWS